MCDRLNTMIGTRIFVLVIFFFYNLTNVLSNEASSEWFSKTRTEGGVSSVPSLLIM